MKKIIAIVMIGFAIAALSMAFRNAETKTVASAPQEQINPFPDTITAIFENSCFHCHGADASDAKAKMHLNLGKWEEMSVSKKVGKLEKIHDMLNKGKMPPSHFLKDNPNAFSAKDKDVLLKWASEESDKLISEGK